MSYFLYFLDITMKTFRIFLTYCKTRRYNDDVGDAGDDGGVDDGVQDEQWKD